MSKIDRTYLLDDEPGMAKVAGGILTRFGYEVRAEINTLKAIGDIGSFKPDLLLLDIQMPHMDGFEVCKKLKQNQNAFLIL